MPVRFSPTESLEDEIRRLTETPGTAPDVDKIVSEAVPTVAPTPTPVTEEAFKPPETPQQVGMRKFREVEQEQQPLAPLQALAKGMDALRAKGLKEGDAVALFGAINSWEGGDIAPMEKLAQNAAWTQDEALQHEIGEFNPWDVPFTVLSREARQKIVYTDPQVLMRLENWLPKGVRDVISSEFHWLTNPRRHEQIAQGTLAEAGEPDYDARVRAAIEKLRKDEDFLAMPPEEQEFVESVLAGNAIYRKSEFYDEQEYDRALRGLERDIFPTLSLSEMLATAMLPIAPAAGLSFLIPSVLAPVTEQVTRESLTKLGLPEDVARIGGKANVIFSYVLAGGGAGLLGGPKTVGGMHAIFKGVAPEIASTVMNPDAMWEDRIMAIGLLGMPVAAHVGAKMKAAPSAKAPVTVIPIESWIKRARTSQRGELVDAVRIPEEGVAASHGTSGGRGASIRESGWQEGGVWLTNDAAFAERYAKATAAVEGAEGGIAVIEARIRGDLYLLDGESPTAARIREQASERAAKDAKEMHDKGEAMTGGVADKYFHDIVEGMGYDGVLSKSVNSVSYYLFDARDALLEGRADPKLPTEADIADAYAFENMSADAMQTPSGLYLLPELPELGKRTPQKAQTDARAQLDWLATSNMFLRKYLPGWKVLADMFSTGQKAFADPLFMGLEEHSAATRIATNWATPRANYLVNLFNTAFGKAERRTDAVGMEGTSVSAIKLSDGKWHPFNRVVTQPSRYDLTIPQQRAVWEYKETTRALTEWQQREGLRPIELAQGEEVWFPRRVEAQELPATQRGARAPGREYSTEKHRLYEKQQEGELAGKRYWDDSRMLIRDSFYAKIMSVADKNLQSWIDYFGETREARMKRNHSDIIEGLTDANAFVTAERARVRALFNAERTAEVARKNGLLRLRARARETLSKRLGEHRVRQQKQARAEERVGLRRARERVAALDEQIKQVNERLKTLPSKKRIEQLVEESEPVQQATNRRDMMKVTYQRYWDRLVRHTPERDAQGRITKEAEKLVGPDIPVAAGKIMSAVRANELKRSFEPANMGMIGDFLIALQAPFRMMWASLDNSAAMLTLGLVMVAHPAAWGNIMGLALKSFFRGGFFERWALENPGLLERSSRYGLQLRVNELLRPMGSENRFLGAIRDKPVVGHAYRASDFMFTTTGDVARLYLWRLWETQWRNVHGEKGLYELANHINRITGVVKAGHPIESIVLFAPKFFRALMATPANAIRGGPAGSAARVFTTRFFLTATAITVLGNMLQGSPYNLNITDLGLSEKEREGRPPPFAIRSGTGYIRVLGPWEPIGKMFAHLARGEPGEVVSRSLRAKLGPAGEVIVDWSTGRDFMGEKMPNLKNPREVVEYLAENLAPFAGKQMIEQLKVTTEIEGGLTPKAVAMAAPNVIGEFLGARATPQFISESINERTRYLIEQVRADKFEIDERLKADIEEHHEDYFVYGNLPSDIRDALRTGDETLQRLISLREERMAEEETEYSGLINLREERSTQLATLSEQLEQGYRVAPDGAHVPYNRKDYKSDVNTVVANTRTQMEQYKKDKGIEDEPLDPNEEPKGLLLMEEFINTVVEPAIDPTTNALDGEVYEVLYNEMADLHENEEFAPGVGVMERVDMMLTSKDDPHYRQMREEMRQLRPYFDFLASAWTPGFIAASDEITWIVPEVASRYRTPYEFETALVNQLTCDLSRECDNVGFGSWGKVWFDKSDEVTFAEEYGARPSMSPDEALAVAKSLVKDRVMVEFWTARSDARKWWFRNKRPDLLALANRWVYDAPPVLHDLLD